jgi:hypothetical protein
MPKKIKEVAVKPECFAQEVLFSKESEICKNCNVVIPCAAEVDPQLLFGLTRKDVEYGMAARHVAYSDAVRAIVKLFPNTTPNAAGLAYTRKVQKYRREHYG